VTNYTTLLVNILKLVRPSPLVRALLGDKLHYFTSKYTKTTKILLVVSPKVNKLLLTANLLVNTVLELFGVERMIFHTRMTVETDYVVSIGGACLLQRQHVIVILALPIM
jgi:hypothetical protein